MKVIIWCLLVSLSVLPWSHSFLSDIGEGLHTDLTELLHLENITYDEFKNNVTYLSKNEFDTRAMGPLYNASKVVIDFIANKQAYPEGMVLVTGGNVEISSVRESWRTWASHYVGSITVLSIAILAAAILPIAGLLWCCCFWCRSNRRRRPFDRKYDACIKAMLALLLIGLITLFIFGVVCAFATETALESSTASAPASIVNGGSDAKSYLQSASSHSRWLLVHNYRQLQSALEQVLAQGGGAISSRLTQFSRAVSVSTLHRMVMQLDSVKEDLTTVHNLTTALRLNAEKLNTGLRKVKAQLLQTLAKCDHPQCKKLQEKYKIGQLDTDIQYSQMPDVSGVLGNVSLLLQSRLQAEVSQGHRVLSQLQQRVQQKVDRGVPQVKQALDSLGNELERIADNLDAESTRAGDWIHDKAIQSADGFTSAHSQYGAYRRMAGLIPALALLIMTLLFSLGVLCGACGRRPDVYGNGDCCDKAAASRTLLIGTGVVFLLGGVVSLIVAIYFIVGITSQRFVCDPLTEPEGNRLFKDVDKFIDIEMQVYNEHKDPNFTLKNIIQKCHNNMSIYQTLDLHRKYDIQSLRAKLEEEISSAIEGLTPSSSLEDKQKVVILPNEAKQRLMQFAQSGLSDFNYDTILDALETNITSLSLDQLGAQLDLGAAELSRTPLVLELQDSAALLRRYHNQIVLPMRRDAHKLNSTALKLRASVRFEHSSLKEAVGFLIGESEAAEEFLNTQGPDLVANLSSSFVSSMSNAVDEYLDVLVNALTSSVGKCAPLSNAYNSTRDAICVNMLLPINGFWLSLSWCVLLFIPLMVISVKLSKLYQHLDPYPGPLVEAEYLYDAYADRDNVPLANAYKSEKRSRRGASPSNNSSAVASSSDTTLQAQHARRYNDMAPKHWEEGPPRYHGPTEYERPPPYYYPGPDDRQ